MAARHILALGAVSLLCAGCRSFAPSEPALVPKVVSRYTVTDLGALAGDQSYAFGLNDDGIAVGESDTRAESGFSHACLYHQERIQDLGTLGGRQSGARGINRAGWVVGSSLAPPYYERAFVHVPRFGLRDLGTLGGQESTATAINDRRQVVGSSHVTGDKARHAMLLTLNVSGMVIARKDLGTLGGKNSSASAINNRGQIAGGADLADGSHHACVWTADGTIRDISPAGSSNGWAWAITTAGTVLGNCLAHGQHQSFLYHLKDRSRRDLTGMPGAGNSTPEGVNDDEQVVGHQLNPGASPFQPFQTALLWDSAGRAQDLNTLIPTGSGWHLDDARRINDRGQIVGNGTHDGKTHAFLLTPIADDR